jgi:putative ABC transport system permease protein
MLGHYLKIAARHLVKHKGHSLINILGLALGMACCLLIVLFVRYEMSYDQFFQGHDRAFRVTQDWQTPGGRPEQWAATPPMLGPTLAKEFRPEVTAAARLMPYFEGSLPGKVAVSYRNQHQFYETFYWADSDIFRILPFPMVSGDPNTALAAPNQVVLTESAARKYFGDENPIGQVLRIDTNYSDEDYRVTGVLRNMPGSSHFHSDILASFSSLDHATDQRVALDQWWLSEPYTYVRLAPGVDPRTVEAKFPALVEKHFGPLLGIPKEKLPKVGFRLQPIDDIHLRGHMDHEMEPNGDIAYIYIFSAIAALTMLVACVNFMNLSTARFAGRAREVGVRKVVGAHRSQLIAQFLGESFLLCALAMVVAVILVRITLPAFNAFLGKQMVLQLDAATWLGLLGLTALVGLIAGSYPAFFLSGFRPVHVLKSSLVAGVGTGAFRRILIVFQFAVSVALLIGAGVIYDQIRYMHSQKLGFDVANVVGIPIKNVLLRGNYLSLKDEIGSVPNVVATTFSSVIVGRELPEPGLLVAGKGPLDTPGSLIVDQDFLAVFHIPLVAGRPLARGEDKDRGAAFLVSEATVRHWGVTPQQALGTKLIWGGLKVGKVVGVVRDFHARPMQFKVAPMILHIRPIAFHYMYVRIAPQGREETLRNLQAVWHRSMPSKPFEYFFVDDEFSHYYRAEERLAKLVGFFALAAVFVACLGLLGLASFTAEKRTREIGIRKVLGSSVGEVVLLLSKELTLLVLLANLIAWPVALVLMRRWLEGFPYRTDIHLWSFILGALIALAIAWVTVSYQALKAALVDPAEALRYE